MKPSLLTWLGLVPVALLSAACGALDASSSVAADPFGEGVSRPPQSGPPASGRTGWEQGVQQPGAVLYARDGSPVGSAPAQPGITRTDVMPRGLEQAGGSRLVLLDLYQQAVDERDELLLEVEAAREMLTAAEDRIANLERERSTLNTQLEALAAERRALELENFEMADRLATGELRRLEAEKRYLEAAIATRTTGDQ